MQTKILSFIAMSFAENAQIDRSAMPTPGPDPVVKLETAEKFSLKETKQELWLLVKVLTFLKT